MSFEDKDVWVGKAADGKEAGEDGANESLEIHDPKRAHRHWFLDGSDISTFPNKRPSLQVFNTNTNTNNNNNHFFAGISPSTLPLWGNGSGFHPVSPPFSDPLFDSETGRALNFGLGTLNTATSLETNSARKMAADEPSFQIDPSFGLSMSRGLDGPPMSGLSFGGIRKVKVNEVNRSALPLSIDLCGGCRGRNEAPSSYGNMAEGAITMGLSYGGGFMSAGSTPFGKPDPGLLMDLRFGEENDSDSSVGRILSEGRGRGYCGSGVSLEHTMPSGGPFGKGVSRLISFGGLNEEDCSASPSGRLFCGYDLLTGQQLSSQRPEAIGDGDALAGENVPKKKEERTGKKVPPNNFPSNVRSLLSTGMLDGVSVKYIAWSREKELRGVIKGSGYLCGCQACSFGKVINAYELERHAGCKTKHPNNHIYFDNGKTIYGVVQELRSTPQAALFDVVQTVTGSAINQKSFRLWKESFMAATRELQRIYGKDEGQPAS